MFRTFSMQLMSKSSFFKNQVLKYFLSDFLSSTSSSIITFSDKSSPRPLEELRPLGAPTTVPPPRPVNRRTAALFTDMEKFLCQKKKLKRKKKMDKTDKTTWCFSPSPVASIKCI